MTQILNVNENLSIKTVIALAKDGNEVVLEENGKAVAKVLPIEEPKERKQRIAGLGKGTMWMSDDFDEELTNEFWGFDK